MWITKYSIYNSIVDLLSVNSLLFRLNCSDRKKKVLQMRKNYESILQPHEMSSVVVDRNP